MPEETLASEPVSALLSEFGTRLNEIEEKQRLLKDRMLLIGGNLVSTKEDYNRELTDIKTQISQINEEIKEIKRLNRRIINEINNFARKAEVTALERQMKMFEPLQTARISDVNQMIKEELAKFRESMKKSEDKTIKKKTS
jgi:hypothetical protein